MLLLTKAGDVEINPGPTTFLGRQQIIYIMYKMRRAYTCDLALKLLNEEITSDIRTHKQNPCKEHLDAYWDHRHNIHIL